MQAVNKFIFDNFCVELRLQINKHLSSPALPATLEFPQLEASLIISGGKEGQPFRIKVVQQQILRVLKVLE